MSVALLSVSDRTGLLEFARALAARGFALWASGGTANFLAQGGLEVVDISTQTGCPEILGGRVKTLHPAIHGAILSRRTPEDRAQLLAGEVDMVVVNLYPFAQQPSVEQIDVGGVALLRAAAKNYEHVTVVCRPQDYEEVLHREGLEFRRELALRAFRLTSSYDRRIAAWLGGEPYLELPFEAVTLRYGENPHQRAVLLGPLGGQLLSGKELSYNNLLDLDAAWRAVEGFEEPAVCVVKHLSPCGLASGAEALQAALDCDRVSAFGGTVASNRSIDPKFVDQLGELFLECLAAPAFVPEALQKLRSRKNLRLFQATPGQAHGGELRSLASGVLWQERDSGDVALDEWRVVTARQPSEEERQSLFFAWRACQHVRSNAIVLAAGTATVGIGGGQPNRLDSVRLAVQRAAGRAHGAILASDGFFPFADGVEAAARAGVTAIVQPGGSIRDQDSIECADRYGIAMVFTGRRHFRH